MCSLLHSNTSQNHTYQLCEPKNLILYSSQKQLWVVSMEAYIFVNARPDLHWKVAEDSLKINGVKTAHAVTGQYDVVIQVVFKNMEALGELIRNVHTIKGVVRTQTAVVVPPRIY